MQVKDLISKLKKFDPELDLEIETMEDTYEDYTIEEAYGTVVIKTF